MPDYSSFLYKDDQRVPITLKEFQTTHLDLDNNYLEIIRCIPFELLEQEYSLNIPDFITELENELSNLKPLVELIDATLAELKSDK